MQNEALFTCEYVYVGFCMCSTYRHYKSILNLHLDLVLRRISNGYFSILDDNGTDNDFKTTLGNTITRYAIQIYVRNQPSLCRRSEKRESDYPTI